MSSKVLTHKKGQKSSIKSIKSKRKNTSKQKNKIELSRAPETIGGYYRVGKEVGKGAFGRVYKCFDTRSGKVVAVKTVSTKNMNKQQLKDIEREVELLAALENHANIVRYIETKQEGSLLCIVLEYVENGSLNTLIKNFGGYVPENVVALYITQILSGLAFLHEQGIIHRDIKAANVLITNDGIAKLADFGVAVKSEGDGNDGGNMDSVAGSPYWMAPEIIEMRGQVTAQCDIWAVGATAIELLEGKPPYHNLQPMSALFRIVQDKHPDIPGKASDKMKDFLFQCFVKEPNLRPGAVELQNHQWLKQNVNKSINSTEVKPQQIQEYDDNKEEVDNLNSMLQDTLNVSKKIMAETLAKQKQEALTKKNNKTNIKQSKQHIEEINQNSIKYNGHLIPVNRNPIGISVSATNVLSRSKNPNTAASMTRKVIKKPINVSQKKHTDNKKPKTPVKEDEDDSPWESEESSSESSSNESEGNDKSSNNKKSSNNNNNNNNNEDDDDEDESSAALDDIEVDLNLFENNFGDNRDDDDDDDDNDNDKDDESDVDWEDDESMGQHEQESKFYGQSQNKLDAINQILKTLDEHTTFLQHEAQIIDDINPNNQGEMPAEKESDIVNCFAKINKIFEEDPKLISQCIKTAVIPIMEMLSTKNEKVTIAALQTIDKIISDKSRGHQHLETLCLVQLIPSIGQMVRNKSSLIKQTAAPFLLKFCKSDKKNIFVRKMFIASGGVSILVDALKNEYNSENKYLIFTAVDCIYDILDDNNKLHNRRDLGRLFAKAKLLKVLIHRLHDTFRDFQDADEAIKYGEKMAQILHKIAQLTDRVVKTHISGVAHDDHEDDNDEKKEYIRSSSLNNSLTKSSKKLKKRKAPVLMALLHLLPALDDDDKYGGKRHNILAKILQCLRELARDGNCVSQLIQNSTMASVVPFLNNDDENIQTHVILILFNMTRVSNKNSAKSCAEAAAHGAIPILKRLILQGKHKAMYFLIPTICKFTSDAKPETLFELKKYNMVQFYLDITKSGYSGGDLSQLEALNALSEWIKSKEYVSRIEFILCQPDNITQLIQVFQAPVMNNKKHNRNLKSITTILSAFKTLITTSNKIADSLGDSDMFLNALGEWLKSDTLDVQIINDLLRMILNMFENLQPLPKKKFGKSILPILDKVYDKQKNKKIVVFLITKQLLPNIWLYVDKQDTIALSPELRTTVNAAKLDKEKEENEISKVIV